MKKIISFLLCIAIMIGTMSAFASENMSMTITAGNIPNLYNFEVSISSQIEGLEITFLVTDEKGKTNYISQGKTNQEGKVVFSYINKGTDDKYIAKAKRMDSLQSVEKPYTLNGMSSIIEDINVAISSDNLLEVTKLLTQSVGLFSINVDMYNGNVPFENISKIFMATQKNMSKSSDVVNGFYDCAIVDLLNTKKMTFENILENSYFNQRVEIDKIFPKVDGKSAYSTVSESVKKEIHTAMESNYKSFKDVKDRFVEKTLLKNIEFGDWKTFEQFLFSYEIADLINFNKADYEKLPQNKKDIVMQKLIKKAFKDYKETQITINEFIGDATYIPPDTDGGGSSSGGSGGGGGNITVPKLDNNDTVAEQKPLPQKKNVFTDLQDTKWAIEAVEYLYNKGIIAGKGERKFVPKADITREEFVKMVVALLDVPAKDIILPFTDVTEDDWSYDYIKRGYVSGIITGKSEDFFDKNSYVTREEAAVILYRVIMKFETNPPSVGLNIYVTFDDIDDASDWAKEEINYLLRTGIILGKVLSDYKPKDNINRAEAATMLYSYLKKVGKVKGVS